MCATTSSPPCWARAGAAFGINHGDVVGDDLSLYPRYLNLSVRHPHSLAPLLRQPRRQLPAADDRLSRETWKRTFGPRHYAFQHGEAVFLVLDNVRVSGRRPLSRRVRPAAAPVRPQCVRPRAARAPRRALHAHPAAVAISIPANPGRYHRRLAGPAARVVRPSAYGELCRPPACHRASLPRCSRWHLSPGHPHHHHVLTAACGSWWSGPRRPSRHPLRRQLGRHSERLPRAVRGGQPLYNPLRPRRHQGPGATARADRRSAPWRRATRLQDDRIADRLGLSVPHASVAASRVIVNVFDGGPRTRVTLEVLGSAAAAAAPHP